MNTFYWIALVLGILKLLEWYCTEILPIQINEVLNERQKSEITKTGS